MVKSNPALEVRFLIVDSLACPPVGAAFRARDVCSCALSFDDGQILRRIGSTKRAADRSQLGYVRFPE